MKLWQRRLLGVFTFGGALIGISDGLTALVSRDHAIAWIICLTAVAFYVWGAWCGVRLLERGPRAENSVLKYWIAQIAVFSCPWFGYLLSSGFQITVSIQFSPLGFGAHFDLGHSFAYSSFESGQPWMIGANLFAVAVAWWLADWTSDGDSIGALDDVSRPTV